MAFMGKSQAGQTPVDKVLLLQSQGISNDQIIATLQREGFASSQIFDAMTQADIKKTISESTPDRVPMPENPSKFRPVGVMGTPPAPPSLSGEDSRASVERIEEIAEAIIDEKWDSLVESVNKVIDWKEKVDGDISALKTKIESLNNNFIQVQKSILGKVEEYDKTMVDVGTDVKALTKVFQKILPGFIENVSELSRITSRIKGVPERREDISVADEEDNRKLRQRRNTKAAEIFEDSIEDIE